MPSSGSFKHKGVQHQYIILGNIIPSIRKIKNIAASTPLYSRLTEDSASAPKYVGVIYRVQFVTLLYAFVGECD